MDTTIYLYDADGRDREIGLDEVNPQQINERQLLWINVLSREESEVKKVFEKLQLKDVPLKKILNDQERPKIEIFEDFFRFFIVSVESEKGKSPERTAIDIIVGNHLIVTIHEGDVDYFCEFRDREKGETNIGELDAESFIATLLDLHIVSYFRALEKVEDAVDKLDDHVLKKIWTRINFCPRWCICGRMFPISAAGFCHIGTFFTRFPAPIFSESPNPIQPSNSDCSTSILNTLSMPLKHHATQF
ncbi:MAG: hypothetical protein HC846_12080 [Blastocatellia bacterium]|nr:hypothetical protein [Blastocatellia bacterium]